MKEGKRNKKRTRKGTTLERAVILAFTHQEQNHFMDSTPIAAPRQTLLLSEQDLVTVTAPPSSTTADHHDDYEAPPTTTLWGMWEMWCEAPLSLGNLLGPTGSGRVSDKLLLQRSRSTSPPNQHVMCEHQALTGSWLDQVRSVGVFDTAEGFWCMHDCLLPPSGMPAGSSFMLFRGNIAPMWELEANRRGGRWVVSLSSAAMADEGWTQLCVTMLAEQWPCLEEEISGACVAAKKRGTWRLSLWTRSADDATAQRAIGSHFKSLLQGLPSAKESPIELVYLRHGPSHAAGGSSPLKDRSPTHAAGAAFAPLYTV